MALLERVSTLVRANLNDLIDKAEEPEKMIKQVILDMHNQLLQVKTQVAIAIADQHLLEKKKNENDEKINEWMRKAELAVDKKQDDLARASPAPRRKLSRHERQLRATAGRSEGPGRESEIGPAQSRSETGRGQYQSRSPDRAAPPRPRRHQSHRRPDRYDRQQQIRARSTA